MPVVNPRGDIVHGLNGVGVFLNNVQIATGDKPCWYDSQTIVYQHIEGLEKYLAFYKLGSPPEITKAHAEGADVLFASGYGHWVARLQTLGIFASDGWTLPAPTAQLLDMGADGAIAYMDASGVHVRETTGDVWLLTNRTGTIYVKLLGQQRAIWVESGAIKTKGLPSVKVMPGEVLDPDAVVVGSRWWLLYWSATAGIVLHPWDSLDGYTLGNHGRDHFTLLTGTSTLRYVWSTSPNEEAVFQRDIVLGTGTGTSGGGEATTPIGGGVTPVTIPGVGPTDATVNQDGTRTLSSSGTFGVVGASAEEIVTIDLEVFPAFPTASGYGRIIHPTLGAFDYEVKPDEWVNIDADAIVPPVWASSRTLTSAANVLWQGHLRDVIVEERWKALGGLSMPVTQMRMLLAIWTNPIDPDVGYVHWYPNYITQVAFKVLPLVLSAGGQGLVFDDVVNYLDEHDDPIGWVTQPVTFQLKLVERL